MVGSRYPCTLFRNGSIGIPRGPVRASQTFHNRRQRDESDPHTQRGAATTKHPTRGIYPDNFPNDGEPFRVMHLDHAQIPEVRPVRGTGDKRRGCESCADRLWGADICYSSIHGQRSWMSRKRLF